MKISGRIKRSIRRIANRHGVEAALDAANQIIGGYGVEVIWGNRVRGYGWPDLEYVNMGDTYASTIIYDHVTNRFLWGANWGSIVESRGYQE
jgi:hypothetical protein